MVRPGLGDNADGIHPVAQSYWNQYMSEFGTPPGRNKMVQALLPQGVSRTRVRQDWSRLSKGMTSAEPIDTEGENDMPETDKVLTALRDETARLDTIERQSGDVSAQIDGILTRLARLESRVATYERAFAASETRVNDLAGQVKSHEIVVLTVKDLLDL
jgi:hypothetical protein